MVNVGSMLLSLRSPWSSQHRSIYPFFIQILILILLMLLLLILTWIPQFSPTVWQKTSQGSTLPPETGTLLSPYPARHHHSSRGRRCRLSCIDEIDMVATCATERVCSLPQALYLLQHLPLLSLPTPTSHPPLYRLYQPLPPLPGGAFPPRSCLSSHPPFPFFLSASPSLAIFFLATAMETTVPASMIV